MKLFTARAVSFILHPLFLSLLATYLVCYHNTQSVSASVNWTSGMGVIVLGILLFEFYGIRHGFFSDFDVSKRRQRTPLFIFVFLMVSALMASILILKGPMELLVGGVYIIIGIIIFSLVNKKIKVSVHVAGIAAFFVFMGLLYGGNFYIGLLCIPLVAWSRVALHRHTVSEVTLGATLGTVLTLIIYGMIQFLR